jgi:hypothetical protein
LCHTDRTAFQPSHVEQIADEAIEPVGFFARGFGEAVPGDLVQVNFVV